MDDGVYYAIGAVLTSGAIIAFIATYYLEKNDRRKKERRDAQK